MIGRTPPLPFFGKPAGSIAEFEQQIQAALENEDFYRVLGILELTPSKLRKTPEYQDLLE